MYIGNEPIDGMTGKQQAACEAAHATLPTQRGTTAF
jgi:hypothetical protein